MRSRNRGTKRLIQALLALLTAGAAMVSTAAPAHADAGRYYYTQWTSDWPLGVDGYIRLSPTTLLTNPQVHADWINVCEYSNCNHWVQTGQYQGFLQYSNSPSGMQTYYENVDQCGVYHENQAGAPPQQDYAYYLTYDGKGSYHQGCPGGGDSTFYVFEYRKGSWTSVPFFYGQLGEPQGLVGVGTEIGPTQAVPLGTDYYGCDANKSCTNSGYGLHLFNTSRSFVLWGSGDWGGTTGPDSPPFAHRYQANWAFATCNVSC